MNNKVTMPRNSPFTLHICLIFPLLPSSYHIYLNPFKERFKPTPSCIPRITGPGMSLLTKPIRPLMPRNSTHDDTNIPAAMISGTFNPGFSARATAAIVFIGCTGIGTSNKKPLNTLYTPVKSKVVPRSNPTTLVSPINRGKNVPRSPNDPDISFHVHCRRPTALSNLDLLSHCAMLKLSRHKQFCIAIHSHLSNEQFWYI